MAGTVVAQLIFHTAARLMQAAVAAALASQAIIAKEQILLQPAVATFQIIMGRGTEVM
jgi:archaellum component FlaG (FlaF/FlaG flagellin family)